MLIILFLIIVVPLIGFLHKVLIRRGTNQWKGMLIVSFITTVLVGFYIPSCWSKYGDMIPTPLFLFWLGNSCKSEDYLQLPLFFFFNWVGLFVLTYLTIKIRMFMVQNKEKRQQENKF